MPIDPSDNNRDDIRRNERRRDEKRAERDGNANAKAGRDFQSKYQNTLKSRETAESKKEAEKAAQKDEGGLFSRIVETYLKKDQTSDQNRKEADKKDESKKDRLEDESHSSPSKTKNADEGHKRVEGSQSSTDQNSGGSSGGGGGSGGGEFSGGHGEGSSGEKGSSGFKGSHSQGSPGTVKAIAGSAFSDSFGSSSQSKNFSQKNIDEIVAAVKLYRNESGDQELDIRMSDDYFMGLRLKASQTANGVVLTFICPTRMVRNAFIIQRPKIYEALKQKNIRVHRIEIS